MRTWLCFCAILSSTWPGGRAERVLGEETDEFDFDGLPGAQHEFKVEVGPGKEECYYQMIKAGGKIHVSFEVLKGGDEMLDTVSIRLPSTDVLEEVRSRSRYVFAVEAPVTGPYAICLDNSYSMMHSKLVYVYYVTYVEEEWEKYNEEIEKLQVTVGNFTSSIQSVQESVQSALVHQAESRMHVLRDWYLITGNNTYIQRWSILQCVVIIGCSCFQVYFVRRLFRTVNVTPTSKPRA